LNHVKLNNKTEIILTTDFKEIEEKPN